MKESEIKGFEDLECWKACRETRNFITNMISSFPNYEKYALTDGMRRAARSITENIAEGYGRFNYQDNIRFCYIARGSLEETLSHLVMCLELDYIPKSLFDSLAEDGEKLTQLINGYIGYLKRSKQGVREEDAFYEVEDNFQFPASDSHKPA